MTLNLSVLYYIEWQECNFSINPKLQCKSSEIKCDSRNVFEWNNLKRKWRSTLLGSSRDTNIFSFLTFKSLNGGIITLHFEFLYYSSIHYEDRREF